jgi:hypothetical protein
MAPGRRNVRLRTIGRLPAALNVPLGELMAELGRADAICLGLDYLDSFSPVDPSRVFLIDI